MDTICFMQGGDEISSEPEAGGPSHVGKDWQSEVHSFNYMLLMIQHVHVLLIIRNFLIVSLCFVV
jgi:hypothetical protein